MKTNKKLQELEFKLSEVERKIQSTSGKTKTKMVKAYADLLEKKEKFEDDFSRISNSVSNEWNAITDDVRNRYNNIKSEINSVLET